MSSISKMIRCAVLGVICFSSQQVYAQATETIVLSIRVGEEIDQDEQQFFRLFPLIDDFSSARIVQENDSMAQALIRRETSTEVEVLPLPMRVIAEFKSYIEHHEEPDYITEQVQWNLLGGLAAYVQRYEAQDPAPITLIDGTILQERILFADPNGIVVWKSSASYQWEDPTAQIEVIPLDIVAYVNLPYFEEAARVVTSSVKRNVLTGLGLMLAVSVGNGSANPDNPGFIGSLIVGGVGTFLSLRKPKDKPQIVRYMTGDPERLVLNANNQAAFKRLIPPELQRLQNIPTHPILASVRQRLRDLNEGIVPKQADPSTQKDPRSFLRLSIHAPYQNSDMNQPRVLSGVLVEDNVEEQVEIRPVVHKENWYVDLALSPVRNFFVGAQYTRWDKPELSSYGVDYFYGQSIAPYLEYNFNTAIVLGKRHVFRTSVGVGASYLQAEVEHLVEVTPVISDILPSFDTELSSYRTTTMGVVGTVGMEYMLSRFASFGIRYSYWHYPSTTVPAREDLLYIGDQVVPLYRFEEYDLRLQQHVLRVGMSLFL